MEPGALWDHMLATAVASELLARELGIKAPPQAFTAALLHDIGRLVLGTNLEVDVDPILELAEEEDIPFQEAETRLLGVNHAEVAAELLNNWKLPESLSETIRWHLDPNGFPGEDKLSVDLLHASNAITMLRGIGLGIDGYSYALCKETEERLQLTPELIERLLSNLDDEIEKLTQSVEA
ncbi:HDOD domain-containing protein [Verrucomicrobiota bacterium]